MKIRITTAKCSAILLAATMLAPVAAHAQVAGIATADEVMAITRAKALSAAYQQIGSTFASNMQLSQTRSAEIQAINQQLITKYDTNKDNQLTQSELNVGIKAKDPLIDQAKAKEDEINKLQEPRIRAEVFAVEQLAAAYDKAQQAVVTAKKINMILAPDAFLWAPPAVDITTAIVAEIDKSTPTVNTAPPADWRPLRTSAAIYQQIQQLLENAAAAQAAQQQQQQQQGQPGAQPGAPATQPAPGEQPENR